MITEQTAVGSANGENCRWSFLPVALYLVFYVSVKLEALFGILLRGAVVTGHTNN